MVARKILVCIIAFTVGGCYTQIRAPQAAPDLSDSSGLRPEGSAPAPIQHYHFYANDPFDPFYYGTFGDPWSYGRSSYYGASYFNDPWSYRRHSPYLFSSTPSWLWDYGYWRPASRSHLWWQPPLVWVPVSVGAGWTPQSDPVTMQAERPRMRRAGFEGTAPSASEIRQTPPTSVNTAPQVSPPPPPPPQEAPKQAPSDKQDEEKSKEEKREEKRSEPRRRGGMR